MKSLVRVTPLLLLWSCLSFGDNKSADWNIADIAWLDYEEGLQHAKQTGKSILLVFYASWCHACHSYEGLFAIPEVSVLADDLVMVRVDVDSRPDLNSKYAEDGLYLPRSLGLTADGEDMGMISDRPHFKHFFPANDVAGYQRLMRAISGATIAE